MRMRFKRMLAVGAVLLLCGAATNADSTVRTVGEDFASIALATADTTVAFDLTNAEWADLFVQFKGDSAVCTVQHSFDNATWANLGTTTDTLNGGASAVEFLYSRGLQLIGSPTDADASSHTRGHAGRIRVIFNNFDSATAATLVKIRLRYKK